MPRDRNTSASPNRLTDDAPHPEIEPRLASLPLPPFDPDRPIGEWTVDLPSEVFARHFEDSNVVRSTCKLCAGVEHVKKGFYCCVCFLFYPDEDSAKKSHCSSRTHYDQLQVGEAPPTEPSCCSCADSHDLCLL